MTYVERRLLGGATALALVVAGVLSWSGGTAHAATATLPGGAALQVSGATDLGPASVQTRSFTVALTPRDQAALQHLIATGATLTPQQYDATYAPTAAAVATVTDWAGSNGLAVSSVPSNHAFVSLSGSQSAVESALGVSFHRFRAPDGLTYTATVGDASLPDSVRSVASSIVGLSDLGRTTAPVRHASTGLSFPSSYGPQDFWSLYNAPSGATGSGQPLAVITAGSLAGVEQDLRTFESTFGLPQVPWTTVQVGTPGTDTSGLDEWDLDTQYSTGFAPDASGIDVYNGPSLSNDDILATINRWVTDDATRQASFSAGECEILAYATGFTASLDAVLQQAAAQGQTLFTSSGDSGSFCEAVVGVNGVPAGIPDVEYPASSPDAIGVGGTTVLGPGPNEVAWYAGGGGSSVVEPTPAWQQGAGGTFLGVQRGVPDVALDADPNSGYVVVIGGQQEIIGGTSASAPSWQGIWARAQGAHSGGLGFAGPVLYGTVPASAFHDIVVGFQGIYASSPGWDYTTGRGTPDITALVNSA